MSSAKFLFVSAVLFVLCLVAPLQGRAQYQFQGPEQNLIQTKNRAQSWVSNSFRPRLRTEEFLTFSQFKIIKIANSPAESVRLAYEVCKQIDSYLARRVQNLNMNCLRALHLQNEKIQTQDGSLSMALATFDLYSRRGIRTGEISGKIHFENIQAESLSGLLKQIKSYCGRAQFLQNQKLESYRAKQSTAGEKLSSLPFGGALICEAQDIESHFDTPNNRWIFTSGVLVLDIVQSQNLITY